MCKVLEARLFGRVLVQRTQDLTTVPPRLSVVKWPAGRRKDQDLIPKGKPLF